MSAGELFLKDGKWYWRCNDCQEVEPVTEYGVAHACRHLPDIDELEDHEALTKVIEQ